MTMVWGRGQNNPITCRDACSDAGRDEPTPTAGTAADIHHNATVLTLVGHTQYRKIVAWEVWAR